MAVTLYENAANEGKLKIYGGGYPTENIEPTCISDMMVEKIKEMAREYSE